LTFDQFKEAMDLVEALIDDAENDEEGDSDAAVSKGFVTTSQKASSKDKTTEEQKGGSEEQELTREIFDDLRGKKKTLSVV
jgi:ABC-type uncharacterized transport system involved in gliding motility auxiliary subunit